jgi:hypothetical protein
VVSRNVGHESARCAPRPVALNKARLAGVRPASDDDLHAFTNQPCLPSTTGEVRRYERDARPRPPPLRPRRRPRLDRTKWEAFLGEINRRSPAAPSRSNKVVVDLSN